MLIKTQNGGNRHPSALSPSTCRCRLAHAARGWAEDPGRGVRHDPHACAAEPPGGLDLTAAAAGRFPRGLPGLDRELVDLTAVAIRIAPHRVVDAALPLLQLGQLESDGLVAEG